MSPCGATGLQQINHFEFGNLQSLFIVIFELLCKCLFIGYIFNKFQIWNGCLFDSIRYSASQGDIINAYKKE